jgi:hypothetical protein
LAQVSCHSSVLNNLVARQEKVRHRTYPGGGLLQKERRVTPDRIRTEPSWSGRCNDPAAGESGPLLRHYGVRSPKAAPARKPGSCRGFRAHPPRLSVVGVAPPGGSDAPVVPPTSRDEAAREAA